MGLGSAEGRIDRAGSVVLGGGTVVVVVELVVDGALVVLMPVVVGANEVDGMLVELVVDGGLVVVVVDDGDGDVVVVADPAAASLQAETSSRLTSTAFGNEPLRPAMRGDHMKRRAARWITHES